MNDAKWKELEPTLARLGVEEIRERLEVSPLIPAGGDVQGVEGCDCHCDCTMPKPDPVRYYDKLFQ